MVPDPGLLEAYARAVVRIGGLAGAPDVVLSPRPDGVVEGLRPVGRAPLHVLTAHDPGSVRLTPAENAGRNHALRAALDRLPRWRTVASDPTGDHAEEGVLVAGLGDASARHLGRRFGQVAVFRWTPWTWSVLACGGGSVVDRGWRLDRLPPGTR